MSRIMTIWIPRWPVQRRILDHPERRNLPMLICRRHGAGALRVVSWFWPNTSSSIVDPTSRDRSCDGKAGRERGSRRRRKPQIGIFMSLSEAMSVLSQEYGSQACHSILIEHEELEADRDSLRTVARWCRRFAPIVALENTACPECIHVDVTGTANLFGGDDTIVRTAVRMLAVRGISSCAAIADTPAAAWAAAHHTNQVASAVESPRCVSTNRVRRWCVVPSQKQSEWLAHLSVASLQVGSEIADRLSELGVHSISQLMQLPRSSLASRFAKTLTTRLSQFEGTLFEPLASIAENSLPESRHCFESPVSTIAAIDGMLDQMLAECCQKLSQQGLGAMAVQMRFQRSKAAPVVIDVGLFGPSTSVRHLGDLLRMRMERVRLSGEVDEIVLEVNQVAVTTCRQRMLFGETDACHSKAQRVGMLVDRFSGRLGRSAVFQPQLIADTQPEYAWIAVPPRIDSQTVHQSETTRSGRRNRARRQPQATERVAVWTHGRRPIRMHSRPLPLEIPLQTFNGHPTQFQWDGKNHTISKVDGPERIETAWWRGASVRRDYYVVETETGSMWWLFRRLRDGRWFLHGEFS